VVVPEPEGEKDGGLTFTLIVVRKREAGSGRKREKEGKRFRILPIRGLQRKGKAEASSSHFDGGEEK